MHEDERPSPWLVASLVIVLPVCLAAIFSVVQWNSEAHNRPSLYWLITRATLASLLLIIPGIVGAARQRGPGLAMFVLVFVPVVFAIAAPLVTYHPLVSPYWAGEAFAMEASGALRRTWTSTASGAFLSAQLAASYSFAAGLWPPPASRVSALVLGKGQQRVPLLLATPAVVVVSAAAWKFAGLAVLESDVLLWLVAATPCLIFGLGPSKPRTRRDAVRIASGAIASALLLALAGQAERLGDVAGQILSEAGQPRWFAGAADIPREVLLRWFTTGMVIAFGLVALLPGRIRLRRYRRFRFVAAVPVAAALTIPAFGTVLPGWMVDRAVRAALRSRQRLLDENANNLPSCAGWNSEPISVGPLAVIPPQGQARIELGRGNELNVAISGETPVRLLFGSLRSLVPAVQSQVGFVVTGCRGAKSGEARPSLAEMVSGNWGSVRIMVVPELDCARNPDSLLVVIERSVVRVLRNACSAVPPTPEHMDLSTAWKRAAGKRVAVGVADGVSVSVFLDGMRGLQAEQAVVVADIDGIQSRFDRAATRDMLVDPGSRGPWKGALLLLAASAGAPQQAHPESLHTPIRAATELYRCFEGVSDELPVTLRLTLRADGTVASAFVEGEGTAGIATCLADRFLTLGFGDLPRTTAVEVRMVWHPSALPAPEGLIASGALVVRGEAESAELRGADGLAARLAPPFARCMGDVLQFDPELTGAAELKICVQRNGVLRPASADSKRLPASALQCMRESMRSMRAEPEHLTVADARCLRAIVVLRSPSEDKPPESPSR